jgi:hypothetical protein
MRNQRDFKYFGLKLKRLTGVGKRMEKNDERAESGRISLVF